MKKRIWLAAAGAAVLFAVILLALLLIGNRQKNATVTVPESKYPCTLRQTKQGMLMTISGGEDGCRWSAATDNPYAVYPAEKFSSAEKSEVLLCPIGDGNAQITLTLEHTEIPYEPVCRLTLLVKTKADSIELLNVEHRSFPAVVRDAEGRYTISVTADGDYLVCMTGSDDSEWVASLESGSAAVRAVQPEWDKAGEKEENAAEDACFLISGSGADSAVVIVTDRKQDTELALTFSRNTEGEFRLDSHELRTAAALLTETAEWALPPGAVLLESGLVQLFSQENGKEIQAESFCIFLNGNAWYLTRAEGQTRNALALRDYRMSDEAAEETETEETESGDRVWIFRTEETWYAAWECEGTAYLLTAADADRAATEAAAGILMEQQP